MGFVVYRLALGMVFHKVVALLSPVVIIPYSWLHLSPTIYRMIQEESALLWEMIV